MCFTTRNWFVVLCLNLCWVVSHCTPEIYLVESMAALVVQSVDSVGSVDSVKSVEGTETLLPNRILNLKPRRISDLPVWSLPIRVA